MYYLETYSPEHHTNTDNNVLDVLEAILSKTLLFGSNLLDTNATIKYLFYLFIYVLFVDFYSYFLKINW